jgi:chaperone LolA
MLKKILISQFLIMFMCGVTHAHTPVSNDEGYAALDKFLNGLQSLQSDFTQTVQDSREQVIEKSTGSLAIKRPGKFRWNYAKPHEQTIVCDGKKIWLYDPELEQVTIRNVDQTISGTPAMLLSGEGANNNLKSSFNVENAQRHEDMLIINLSPKRADADFKLVQLALKNTDLVAMSLTDKLGQTTLVEFKQFKRNAAIADAQFAFAAPKGADVIDNTKTNSR